MDVGDLARLRVLKATAEADGDRYHFEHVQAFEHALRDASDELLEAAESAGVYLEMLRTVYHNLDYLDFRCELGIAPRRLVRDMMARLQSTVRGERDEREVVSAYRAEIKRLRAAVESKRPAFGLW